MALFEPARLHLGSVLLPRSAHDELVFEQLRFAYCAVTPDEFNAKTNHVLHGIREAALFASTHRVIHDKQVDF